MKKNNKIAFALMRGLCRSRKRHRQFHSSLKYASEEAVRKLEEDVSRLTEEYKSLREAFCQGNQLEACNVIVLGDIVRERKINLK